MVVLKYGGTSVGSADNIYRILGNVAHRLDEAPVLVASAMGKTTDALVQLKGIYLSEGGRHGEPLWAELKGFHDKAAEELLDGALLTETRKAIYAIFDELGRVLAGISLLGEITIRVEHKIVSYGELLSTLLIEAKAKAMNIPVEWVDARTFVFTKEGESQPSLLEEKTQETIRDKVVPEKGKLIVTQGFIASTSEGHPSTLGRGGSDYTAALIAAALNADKIEIWTDVDGILTSDPNVVEKASILPDLSYDEAGEMAYFGAKVLHPATIRPAVKKGIPLFVLNALRPDLPGTRITRTSRKGLKAITGKKSITLITINSFRMLEAWGFLHKIFAVFNKYSVSVDLVTTSEVSVSVTIDDDSHINEIKDALAPLGEVDIKRECAIISLIGGEHLSDKTLLNRTFSIIGDAPLHMISLAANKINLSIVTDGSRFDDLLIRLHRETLETE